MTLALVHDYLTEMGGAERVVQTLTEIFPEAPLYTSVYNQKISTASFRQREIRCTFMQRLPRQKAATKVMFPLFPLAFRSLRLDEFDTVLSSSSGFAHHVRTRDEALHVCYCYTPPRFLWQPEEYFRNHPSLRLLLAPALTFLRRLDLEAAHRVDAYVAISQTVADRIRRTYGREADVIHPPIDTSQFAPTRERSERFLVVSRLLAYKRIDLAVKAATRLGVPLDVIGDGPDRQRLEHLAGPTVRFLLRQPDDVVRHAMATSTALILPGSEDFGLTTVETQASGRPVVAYASGGALETIEDGVTGFLFREQSVESLLEAMRRANTEKLESRKLLAAASRFDRAVFEHRLRRFLAPDKR